MRLTHLVHGLLCVLTLYAPAMAQDAPPLEGFSEFGYQTLMEGAPSRAGFPRGYDCPEVVRHVYGHAWNEWTAENLPEGCREPASRTEPSPRRSRFELRTYFDIGTIGWDNNYGTIIPSIGGFHMSFANIGGWKLGAGGLLASFSPVFDLRTQQRRYEISPRLNLFNVNKKLKELSASRYDLFFSLEATREMFLPPQSAERSVDGSAGFNNVFFGIAFSRRPN